MESEAVSLSEQSPIVTQDLGWALGTLLRAYQNQGRDAVAELPGGARGYQVLSIAASGACPNQAAIAERLGVDRTVMTYLLDELEAKKLVVRTPDPLDRRSRRVTLTPKGTVILEKLTERMSQVERRILADLTDAESEQLRSMLGRAAQVVDEHAPDAEPCEFGESVPLRA
jgi:MarR family transcriptional regulator, transcriptional regulator for hemolysin